MAFPKKQLAPDEHVVIATRTHWKKVVAPAVVFILLCFATGAVMALGVPRLPAEFRFWGNLAVVVLAVLAALVWCVVPFLRWLTTTYTVTNRRLITRSGLLTIRGHDLPLVRINNVTYERSLSDRIFGCGSVTLTTAADEPLTVDDVPNVERVHLTMTELLFSDAEGRDRRADN